MNVRLLFLVNMAVLSLVTIALMARYHPSNPITAGDVVYMLFAFFFANVFIFLLKDPDK